MSKIENNASGTPDSYATQSASGQPAADSVVNDYTNELLCSSAQGAVLKNYLVFRFSIVLVVLAILAVGVYWINLKIIDTDSSNAAAINQSGKQRLNTLRIAFSALLVSKAVNEKQRETASDMLMKAATAMEQGHDKLTLRRDGFIPPSRYTSGLASIYYTAPYNLDERSRQYFLHAFELAAKSRTEVITANDPDLMYIQQQSMGVLPDGLDAAVNAFQAYAEKRVHRLSTIQLVALVATLLLLGVIAAIIFRPMARHICSAQDKLGNIADQMERMAYTDPLTRTNNRRKYAAMINRELYRVRRYNTPMTALLMDIDHFKETNDKHGHQVGDEILISLAQLIQANIRSTDYLFRWGGEEFLVLLTDTPVADGLIVAEKLRSAVEHIELVRGIQVTISIGVTKTTDSDDEDTLVRRADEAMYKAKENGRNRIETMSG